jgi:phosphoadenosine phosphosulfate reductase
MTNTEESQSRPFAADSYEREQIEGIAQQLEGASPTTILEWAFAEFADEITIATGFGVAGAALLDIAAKVHPRLTVFFLDTDFLFPQTYALRHRLEKRYGIEIRAFKTSLTPELQEQQHGAALWSSDPDLCCRLRKLEPMKEALRGYRAWMTAIRREQTPARAKARVVEWDERWNLIKVNPLAKWSKRELWHYVLENDVPYNPLHDEGYLSIGCTHCTRAVQVGEGERAGRWAGFTKTECGLHLSIDEVVNR